MKGSLSAMTSNNDIIEFLQQTLGPEGAGFVILTALAVSASFYLANQYFSLKERSLAHKGMKQDEVKALLEAVGTKEDLLIEEAFFQSYGFSAQAKEVTYIIARDNQRNLILDLKKARLLLAYNPDTQDYEYSNRYPLKTKRRVQGVVYWTSAVIVYFTPFLAIVAQTYTPLIFFPIFALTTYVAVVARENVSAMERVLAGTLYPVKKDNPAANTAAPTGGVSGQ